MAISSRTCDGKKYRRPHLHICGQIVEVADEERVCWQRIYLIEANLNSARFYQ